MFLKSKEPPKINIKRVMLDLAQSDDDIRIFALRTVIRIESEDVAQLTDEIRTLRERIESSLGDWVEEVQFYGRQALDHLKRELDHIDDRERERSAPAESDEIDLSELESDDESRVMACLQRLAKEGDDYARPAVERLLKDTTDANVIALCLDALKEFGGRIDLFAFRDYLRHTNDRVRSSTVALIAALCETEVMLSLVRPLLEDPNRRVVCEAIVAVGLHEPATIAPLLEGMGRSQSEEDRVNLPAVLVRLNNEKYMAMIKDLAQDSSPAVRLKVVEALASSELEQKTFLLKILIRDGDKQIASRARMALQRDQTAKLLQDGSIETSQVDMDIVDFSPKLDLEELKAEEPERQLACLREIEASDHAQAHDALVEFLGLTENRALLAEAIRVLAHVGSSGDLNVLLHFTNHDAVAVRIAAARAVAQLADPARVVYFLVPLLLDADHRGRGAVGRLLGRFGLNNVLSCLQAMVCSPRERDRQSGIAVLLAHGGPKVVQALGQVIRDPSPAIRRFIATELIRRPVDEAQQLLSPMTTDADPTVKAEAIKSLQILKRRQSSSAAPLPPLPPLEQLLNSAVASSDDLSIDDLLGGGRRKLSSSGIHRRPRKDQSIRVRDWLGRNRLNLESSRELRELVRGRDEMLHSVGDKLWKFVKAGKIKNEAFDRPIFKIKKFLHLLEGQKASDAETGPTGFLAKIQNAAGLETRSQRAAQLEGELDGAFRELGRVLLRLHEEEGLVVEDFHDEYYNLDKMERAIEDRLSRE